MGERATQEPKWKGWSRRRNHLDDNADSREVPVAAVAESRKRGHDNHRATGTTSRTAVGRGIALKTIYTGGVAATGSGCLAVVKVSAEVVDDLVGRQRTVAVVFQSSVRADVPLLAQ